MAEPSKPKGMGGQDDLAILFPERSATIAGVAITMREYSFVETLEHHARIARLTDAITGIALRGDFADLDSLRGAFGDCRADIVDLMALACDQPAAWIIGLNADDGEHLMMLWWAVNSGFFLRRVLLSVGMRKAREFDGEMSSAPTSPTATPPPTSDGTRNVN